MRKRIFYIMVLFLFIACSSENKHVKKFYSNGNIESEYDTISNGSKNGKYKSFYKSGRVKETGKYMQGKVVGWFAEFYEDGKVKKKTEYVLIPEDSTRMVNDILDAISIESLKKMGFTDEHNFEQKVSYENRVICYDKKGMIEKWKSSFFSIKMNDTIQLGDTLHFLLNIESSYYKTGGPGQLAVAILDSKGNKKTQISSYTMPFYKCYFIPKQKGIGYIYGEALEVNETIKEIHTWYIREPYFVKE